MDGLLNYQPDPIAQGLIAFGGGLLTPRGQGGGIHAGLLGANQAMTQAAQQRQQMAMQAEQMRRQRAMDGRQQQMDALTKQSHQNQLAMFPTQLESAQYDLKHKKFASDKEAEDRIRLQGAMQKLTSDPKFATDPGMRALFQINPLEAIKRAYPEMKFHEINNAQGQKQGAFVAPGQAPQFVGGAERKLNDLVQIGPDGAPRIDPLALEARKSVAKAGASNISMVNKTDTELNKAIAKNIGDAIGDSRTSAQKSVQSLATIESIRDALDTDKVLLGPTASKEVWVRQLGARLGVAGANDAEVLANTRKTVQGLAQLELDASGQLKGQGAVTEAERQILKRAASGDIDSLTPNELRVVLKAGEVNARASIQRHNKQTQGVAQSPGIGQLGDILQVQEPPPRANKQGLEAAPSIDSLVDKYRKR